MNGYKKNKPYFVAEISANHCGNFQLAKKIIKCAKVNGADAVKLQTFTADTITMKSKKIKGCCYQNGITLQFIPGTM